MDPFVAAVSITSTAVLVLYLWWPLIATCALAVVFALSFFTGTQTEVLTVAALAAALVMRLGWNALILSYAGVFLLATALVAFGETSTPINLGIYLISATVAGAVGFVVVRLVARRHEAVVRRRRRAQSQRRAEEAAHAAEQARHQADREAERAARFEEAVARDAALRG